MARLHRCFGISHAAISALGVTDYYLTEAYEEIVRQQAAGRLLNVGLIFPNIEVRLDVAARTGFVNLHLMVSPEDTDHIEQVGRILSRLSFSAHNDQFNCTKGDLIRLGRRAAPALIDDRSALQHGATQFKVGFAELRRVFSESEWARNNILIAIAGGADDGTSGLRQAADTTVRQESKSSLT